MRALSCTIVAVMALLAAGCGSAPPRPSAQQESALQWNQRGQAAFARGDYAGALSSFQQALAVNRAIESVDGIARELVNLSTVHRRLGERDKARAALGEILDPSGIPFSGAQRAEATYQLALYAAEDGDGAQAATLSERALSLCGDCGLDGAVRNFQAGLRLSAGDAAGARELARRALDSNRRRGEREEEANSQRLTADAALQLNDPAAAATAYQEALALDKAAGASRKIALDLLGLGRAAQARGDRRQAADYYERARSVAEGARDEVLRRQAEQRLKAVNP